VPPQRPILLVELNMAHPVLFVCKQAPTITRLTQHLRIQSQSAACISYVKLSPEYIQLLWRLASLLLTGSRVLSLGRDVDRSPPSSAEV